MSGATVGAFAGSGGGFVGGAGNAWAGGAGFGEGLLSGLKGGGWGALSGGLIGGVAGGISAVKNERNFWNGDPWEITHDYKLPGTWSSPDGNLPIHMQADETVGCTQKTLESMAEYKMQDIKIPIDGGADFRELAESLGYDVNRNYNNVHSVGRQMLKGNPSAITYNNRGVQHTVGINRIQVLRTTRIFGNGYRYKYFIKVMDPLKQYYSKLSYSIFKSGIIRTLGFYHGFVRSYNF
ncbi:MAG: hypothetical protein GXO47_06205 [Chlorobi bacterium]|nr:hypothetical protein [Chlorobiota bacterium]